MSLSLALDFGTGESRSRLQSCRGDSKLRRTSSSQRERARRTAIQPQGFLLLQLAFSRLSRRAAADPALTPGPPPTSAADAGCTSRAAGRPSIVQRSCNDLHHHLVSTRAGGPPAGGAHSPPTRLRPSLTRADLTRPDPTGDGDLSRQ